MCCFRIGCSIQFCYGEIGDPNSYNGKEMEEVFFGKKKKRRNYVYTLGRIVYWNQKRCETSYVAEFLEVKASWQVQEFQIVVL